MSPAIGTALEPFEPNTVLIVEDSTITYLAMRRMLLGEGWNTAHAGSIADAKIAVGCHPFAVLLDLRLPDGEGAELLRVIREERLPIKVVVITGAPPDSQRYLDAKALDPESMLAKPIQWEDLTGALGTPGKPDPAAA